ncbi:XamI family restriction endonuclease [Corynebacterium belfantii]
MRATLRMVTAPPLARDRLAGLAGVSTSYPKTPCRNLPN